MSSGDTVLGLLGRLTQKSYDALINETLAQYEALRRKGYKFDFYALYAWCLCLFEYLCIGRFFQT